MAFVRSIGRWTMTALVINCIIGGSIFGLPGELTCLLGRASPIAMIFSALCMAVIRAPIAEVASQFSSQRRTCSFSSMLSRATCEVNATA
jgi:amino acid transporter